MSDRGERRRPDQEKLQELEEVKRKGVPKTEQGAVEAGGGVCGQVVALEGGDDREEGEDTDQTSRGGAVDSGNSRLP